MRKASRSVVLTASLFVLTMPHLTRAFEHEQYPPGSGIWVAWRDADMPVRYHVNSAHYPVPGDPSLDLVHTAFREWESAAWGQITFAAGTTMKRGLHSDDDENTISFGDPYNQVAPGVFAITQWVIRNEQFTINGHPCYRLRDVDIVFDDDNITGWGQWARPEDANCSDWTFTYRGDIHTAALHEVGHLLGLDHSVPGSTMGNHEACNVAASTLSPDDVAGARSIYPPPANAALHRYAVPYSIPGTPWVTFGYEATEHSTELREITDGSLAYNASAADACAGWRNDDYNERMTVSLSIDLGETCRVTRIRYNVGNVQRAESWNADLMISSLNPTGTPTTSGGPYSGVWTEHTGTVVTNWVDIRLEKTRVSPETDWLFVGEIEVIAEPHAPLRVSSATILGPNNTNIDPTAALGSPDGRPVSLGVGGQVVLDFTFGSGSLQNERLVVHEAVAPVTASVGSGITTSDADTEGFTAYGHNRWAGWIPFGNGAGTQGVRVPPCGFDSVMIVDVAGGDPNSTTPGFDLDGISLYDSLVTPRPFVVTPVFDSEKSQPSRIVPISWAPDGVSLYYRAGFFVYRWSAGDSTEFTSIGNQFLDDFNDRKLAELSRDGTQLAMFSKPLSFGPYHLQVLTISTGEVRTLFSDALMDLAGPAWSPDGSTIAFVSDGHLFTIPASGGTPAPLVGIPSLVTSVDWSPTQNLLAYSLQVSAQEPDCARYGACWIDGGRNEVRVISYPSGSEVQRFQVEARSTLNPEWSPDGHLLSCNVSNDPWWVGTSLWIVDPANLASATRITDNRCIDNNATWHPSRDEITFDRHVGSTWGMYSVSGFLSAPTDAGLDSTASQQVKLSVRNYPNPFNPTTTVRFSVARPGPVTLDVHDVTGRRVLRLLDRPLPQGSHELTWDGRDHLGRRVASGVYFCRISSGQEQRVQRMVVVR